MNTNSGNPIPPAPDNYLLWAILTTICCCLPLGIVAIVKAAKVNGLHRGGFYEEAEQASKEAKKWTIYSAVAGIVYVVLYFTVVFPFINS